jgi:hypothetical protein
LTWLRPPTSSLDTLTARDVDTLTARDKAFIDVIESVGLDKATAIQVYSRFVAALERPIQSEIHWGVESLSEVSGIDPWQLKGEWYRARTKAL